MGVSVGIHPYNLVLFFMFAVGYLLPILLGFLWIRPDANTRGQPGMIWALLTIPLAWVAVLAYVVVRAFTPPATYR